MPVHKFALISKPLHDGVSIDGRDFEELTTTT